MSKELRYRRITVMGSMRIWTSMEGTSTLEYTKMQFAQLYEHYSMYTKSHEASISSKSSYLLVQYTRTWTEGVSQNTTRPIRITGIMQHSKSRMPLSFEEATVTHIILARFRP